MKTRGVISVKWFIPVIVLLMMLVASPAWADINIAGVYNQMPDLYRINQTAIDAQPYQYMQPIQIVNEAVYLENSFPAFKKNDYNLYIVNQTVSNGDIGFALYQNCAFLFAYPATWSGASDLLFTPAVVAHELGHCVRKRYLTDEELDQYIAQRGITDDERTYFHKYFPNENMNEEVFAEDFRQLFGGPNAHFTLYYDNIPPPTNVDRQWILAYVNSVSLTMPQN
jgi:hypothetical protein